jgi:hypothetical protein
MPHVSEERYGLEAHSTQIGRSKILPEPEPEIGFDTG